MTADGPRPEDVRGLPREPFTQWAAHGIPDLGPDWHATLVAGGLSNLTYRVTGRGRSVIVRRPPPGPLLPSAHDMVREHRVLSALQGTAVPVPAVLALCEDPGVLGAPFYVMADVEGVVHRDPEDVAGLPESARDALCDDLVAVLAAIHATDLDATGLRDFGRPDGYLARQLSRWTRQWEASRTRDLPTMDALLAALDAGRPGEGEVTLVHGDYRHDNTIVRVGDDGVPRVAAVVDWELSTLGDPLADLATWLTYWTGRDDTGRALIVGAGVPALPGFPSASGWPSGMPRRPAATCPTSRGTARSPTSGSRSSPRGCTPATSPARRAGRGTTAPGPPCRSSSTARCPTSPDAARLPSRRNPTSRGYRAPSGPKGGISAKGGISGSGGVQWQRGKVASGVEAEAGAGRARAATGCAGPPCRSALGQRPAGELDAGVGQRLRRERQRLVADHRAAGCARSRCRRAGRA